MTFDEERALKIFDSMIQISVSGFKLLALLNGGAAVALLAYLGNITKVAITGAPTTIGMRKGDILHFHFFSRSSSWF